MQQRIKNVLGWLGLAALATACQDRATTTRRGPLQPCRVPGIEETLLCGTLTVPENREMRSGRTIPLNVVVLPALQSGPKHEPLFEFAGGPGVAATGVAGFYAREGRAYRRNRDVVLVDQRGTGKSNPLTAERKKKSAQDYFGEMYPVAFVEALRRQLEPRADLTQYTTPIAMDDLDDVRAWLGYERINLFGLSYGSRAALVYMRQHPERVRSVVLLGTTPTGARVPLFHARGAKRALDLLFEECARDGMCSRAFPQLGPEFDAMLARLHAEPARVPHKNNETVEIRADIFAEKLRNLMYSSGTRRRVPWLIHRAATGDFAPFIDAVIEKEMAAGPEFIADGMYLGVTCAEDVPFIDLAEAAQMNVGNPFGNYRVEQQTRACSMWPRGQIPPGYHDPVVSDAPVLLISGWVDPVTPPDWAEEVARHLPNSRLVVVPALAHSPDGLTNGGCLDEMIVRFLDSLDPRALDVSCVEQIGAPDFQTRESR